VIHNRCHHHLCSNNILNVQHFIYCNKWINHRRLLIIHILNTIKHYASITRYAYVQSLLDDDSNSNNGSGGDLRALFEDIGLIPSMNGINSIIIYDNIINGSLFGAFNNNLARHSLQVKFNINKLSHRDHIIQTIRLACINYISDCYEDSG
jgi:hypothetical protein